MWHYFFNYIYSSPKCMSNFMVCIVEDNAWSKWTFRWIITSLNTCNQIHIQFNFTPLLHVSCRLASSFSLPFIKPLLLPHIVPLLLKINFFPYYPFLCTLQLFYLSIHHFLTLYHSIPFPALPLISSSLPHTFKLITN